MIRLLERACRLLLAVVLLWLLAASAGLATPAGSVTAAVAGLALLLAVAVFAESLRSLERRTDENRKLRSSGWDRERALAEARAEVERLDQLARGDVRLEPERTVHQDEVTIVTADGLIVRHYPEADVVLPARIVYDRPAGAAELVESWRTE